MKEQDKPDHLRLMRKMVDIFAHDVRNPLNNILLSTAQFKLGDPPDKEDMAFYIDIIESNCDRINALLAELAYMIREQDIRPGLFNITELIGELLEEREERFALKHIRIAARPDKFVAAYFDPEKMKAALAQLLENAIDALPDGGTVMVDVTEHEGMVRIKVQDSGPGIDPHILPYIFDPFFTTRKHHRGLGLTLVKNVADAHRATITVSGQGEPACFTLLLPSGTKV